MLELGTGVLNWRLHERSSDRYGCVFLTPSVESEERILLPTIAAGKHGRLAVIVKEVRDPHHIGDRFHKVIPVLPEVGAEITLGMGTLFFEDDMVGTRPDDGRPKLWLNIQALYNAHNQTVILQFVEC